MDGRTERPMSSIKRPKNMDGRLEKTNVVHKKAPKHGRELKTNKTIKPIIIWKRF